MLTISILDAKYVLLDSNDVSIKVREPGYRTVAVNTFDMLYSIFENARIDFIDACTFPRVRNYTSTPNGKLYISQYRGESKFSVSNIDLNNDSDNVWWKNKLELCGVSLLEFLAVLDSASILYTLDPYIERDWLTVGKYKESIVDGNSVAIVCVLGKCADGSIVKVQRNMFGNWLDARGHKQNVECVSLI